ncbi:DUF3429 domain-containing protein [Rheinheimera sp. EpRS3]|uniref:DUF3429 domain-containing protein n=1 Tax=Rheinheimera sp. EpRS3 TaxID=1712383 RepID=UPI000747064F|nr:DUF3429 domain-containing protein [Rheinheimera sp. EpRS3]KUM54999.1 hypothetical protein AR688_17300 [Rheinheimera sp. EpRS3]
MSRLSVLGYAGLMPFIALPLLYLQPFYLSAAQTLELYSLYSALILGFMAGVLWPVLHSNTTTTAKADRLAIAAVIFPVLSFIALFTAVEYFLLAQACLFVLLRLTEYRLGINRQYSIGYRALRNQLTLVVSASHLSFYWLIH